MSTDAAVEVVGISKAYGATAALADVSFRVRPGELFGVVGPDGAGKTTLFRILVTLLLADRGRASVLGLDVVGDLWALRRRIGYMPGRFALYPDLSAQENLDFFATVFSTSSTAGAHLIAPIWNQLAAFADRRAGALSGGMKQKLALCCALVHTPDILFLDEPTTGVDAVSRREFWDLLTQLRHDGLTIVVSTAYMDEASRCDRVLLLQQGRVLLEDTPTAISAGYPRPLLAISAADRLGLLHALRRLPHAAEVWPFGSDVHYTDDRTQLGSAEIADEVQAALAAAGVTASRPVATPASVEDAFIWHMRRTGTGAA